MYLGLSLCKGGGGAVSGAGALLRVNQASMGSGEVELPET